jgi:tripartite-type tricarboxylate transporter receptor subunit TctC
VVDAFAAALADPAVKEKFNGLGFEIVANTPEQFAAFQKAEEDRWRQVVSDGKIVSQ